MAGSYKTYGILRSYPARSYYRNGPAPCSYFGSLGMQPQQQTEASDLPYCFPTQSPYVLPQEPAAQSNLYAVDQAPVQQHTAEVAANLSNKRNHQANGAQYASHTVNVSDSSQTESQFSNGDVNDQSVMPSNTEVSYSGDCPAAEIVSNNNAIPHNGMPDDRSLSFPNADGLISQKQPYPTSEPVDNTDSSLMSVNVSGMQYHHTDHYSNSPGKQAVSIEPQNVQVDSQSGIPMNTQRAENNSFSLISVPIAFDSTANEQTVTNGKNPASCGINTAANSESRVATHPYPTQSDTSTLLVEVMPSSIKVYDQKDENSTGMNPVLTGINIAATSVNRVAANHHSTQHDTSTLLIEEIPSSFKAYEQKDENPTGTNPVSNGIIIAATSESRIAANPHPTQSDTSTFNETRNEGYDSVGVMRTNNHQHDRNNHRAQPVVTNKPQMTQSDVRLNSSSVEVQDSHFNKSVHTQPSSGMPSFTDPKLVSQKQHTSHRKDHVPYLPSEIRDSEYQSYRNDLGMQPQQQTEASDLPYCFPTQSLYVLPQEPAAQSNLYAVDQAPVQQHTAEVAANLSNKRNHQADGDQYASHTVNVSDSSQTESQFSNGDVNVQSVIPSNTEVSYSGDCPAAEIVSNNNAMPHNGVPDDRSLSFPNADGLISQKQLYPTSEPVDNTDSSLMSVIVSGTQYHHMDHYTNSPGKQAVSIEPQNVQVYSSQSCIPRNTQRAENNAFSLVSVPIPFASTANEQTGTNVMNLAPSEITAAANNDSRVATHPYPTQSDTSTLLVEVIPSSIKVHDQKDENSTGMNPVLTGINIAATSESRIAANPHLTQSDTSTFNETRNEGYDSVGVMRTNNHQHDPNNHRAQPVVTNKSQMTQSDVRLNSSSVEVQDSHFNKSVHTQPSSGMPSFTDPKLVSQKQHTSHRKDHVPYLPSEIRDSEYQSYRNDLGSQDSDRDRHKRSREHNNSYDQRSYDRNRSLNNNEGVDYRYNRSQSLTCNDDRKRNLSYDPNRSLVSYDNNRKYDPRNNRKDYDSKYHHDYRYQYKTDNGLPRRQFRQDYYSEYNADYSSGYEPEYQLHLSEQPTEGDAPPVGYVDQYGNYYARCEPHNRRSCRSQSTGSPYGLVQRSEEQSPIQPVDNAVNNGDSCNQTVLGQQSVHIQPPLQAPIPARKTPANTLSHGKASLMQRGKLVVVQPNQTQECPPANVLVDDSTEILELKAFPGPLTRNESLKSDVIKFCKDKVQEISNAADMIDRESAHLIWRFLEMFIRQNGIVIGSEIADVLLEGQEIKAQKKLVNGCNALMDTSNVSSAKDTDWQCRDISDRSIVSPPSQAALDRFRELCLFGRTKNALEFAMRSHLWEQALFLATRMGPTIFASVSKRYTNSALSVNDPLKTLYLMMSGKQPVACTMVGSEGFGDWKPHLAVILSHSTEMTELERKAIVAMGETLATRGQLQASQFCHLMANCLYQESPEKTTKLVLLDSNQRLPPEKHATNLSLQMIQVYAYGMSLANPRFCIPGFQAYKVIYATRLAEAGLAEEALHYCNVLSNTIMQPHTSYPKSLVQAVTDLGKRLKGYNPERQLMEEHLPDSTWLENIQALSKPSDQARPLSVAPTVDTELNLHIEQPHIYPEKGLQPKAVSGVAYKQANSSQTEKPVINESVQFFNLSYFQQSPKPSDEAHPLSVAPTVDTELNLHVEQPHIYPEEALQPKAVSAVAYKQDYPDAGSQTKSLPVVASGQQACSDKTSLQPADSSQTEKPTIKESVQFFNPLYSYGQPPAYSYQTEEQQPTAYAGVQFYNPSNFQQIPNSQPQVHADSYSQTQTYPDGGYQQLACGQPPAHSNQNQQQQPMDYVGVQFFNPSDFQQPITLNTFEFQCAY